VGDDVLIGPRVTIYSQNHRFSRADVSIREQGYTLAPVTIQDNVWVAAGCIILPGVTVGTGAVIAAGSVITQDVEPNSLVAGNPARKLRARTE
jgi:acetyltransferase-like isoleucine patch superfamily enzyme